MAPARHLHSVRSTVQRRQEPRFFARVPIRLLSSRKREVLFTWNVSFRGLFVETTEPAPVRHLVRFGVTLPTTGTELVLHGMVVHVVGPNDPEGRPQGMGIELYGGDRESRGGWWGMVRFVRDRLDELGLDDEPSGIRFLA